MLSLAVLSAAAALTAPHLTIATEQPLSLRGTGFKAHEVVLVQAAVSQLGTARATVHASAAGRFVVTFRSLRLATCSAYALRAKGTMGSLVTVRVARECNPAG